jgi:hypothetical protein
MNKEERAAYQREYRKQRKQNGVNGGENVNSLQESVNKPVNWEAEARQLRREVEALRAEVSRLKQLLAGRPKGPEINHIPLPQKFAGSFSRADQAKGRMPNRSPLARMSEDN